MPEDGVLTTSTKAAKWGFYKPLIVQNKRDLEMSWQRCLDAGMDPGDRPDPVQIARDKLGSFYKADDARIRGLALAEMRTLYTHLGHRGFTLTFANADSVILDRIPGKDIVDGRRRGDDLAPGNCWYESARGTNAVGTAANTKHTIFVMGDDHYLRTYQRLICIAKPIFKANGEVAAILDATVQRRHGQMDLSELAYVLGLMHMSADHIETELFKERHYDSLVIQTNAVSKTTTSSNAAFAFDDDGWLLDASRAAVSAFEDLDIQRGCHFEKIFRLDFPGLRSLTDAPVDFLEIKDYKGRDYYATVYYPRDSRPDVNMAQPSPSGRPPDHDNTVTDAPSGNTELGNQDGAVLDAMATVERATQYGAHVLIRGETGTGKELLARHIHRTSGRRGEFVAVNCAAMPEHLIEAELFGYAQGAFTGARRGGSAGLVRQADGGTLFLDEIGDMPFELQGRLLRLLDTWQVRPVGSQQAYAVDVRLVTATNCDLERAVAEGHFRLDLLHRIKVVEVRLPALRERTDFDYLAHSLLSELKPAARLDDGGLTELRALEWAGNMRELRNVLTRLLIRAESDVITRDLVTKELCLGEHVTGAYDVKRQSGSIDGAQLEAVFRRCSGNVAATARQLGVSRTTVYKHLRQLRKAGSILDKSN